MNRLVALFAVWMLGIAGAVAAKDALSLEGAWRFKLDRNDSGQKEQWYESDLIGTIHLPGSLQEQGFGDDISINTQWIGDINDRSWFENPKYEKYRQPGNVKIPFFLQADKHYVGPAWYQREIMIPDSWAAKRIVLSLERPHWETRVWVDDQYAGLHDSLSTLHRFDLTSLLTPGRHRLTIRVDNRLVVNVGPNSHSVSDHTQSSWNGIVGELTLEATDRVWIKGIQVYPNVPNKTARVVVDIGNVTGRAGAGTLSLAAASYNSSNKHTAPAKNIPIKWQQETTQLEVDYPMSDDVQLWDEFSPALYRLEANLDGASGQDSYSDSASVSFGMREISAEGTQFTINSRKIFLRGTLECCIFPLTGYPPTKVEPWKRIIRVCQAHGLNHIRFHSWCPPEAAFVAADELGFYYHVECSSWANQGASVGDGKPLDKWIYAESDRILQEYGNHPSFILLAYGNEPAGKNLNQFLGALVDYWKQKDPRRKYTSGAGWPIIPENDYHSTPAPRVQAWGSGLNSRINSKPPETMTDYSEFVGQHSVPIVSHEIGQWCVYPNFDEIPKYTGVLKAKNFEIFKEDLESKGMGRLARAFLLASGKLQTLCYKEDIESALRTPGFGGFQLLDLHDFPGQGTALVGVVDPFWDSKGYVTPYEFHRFACETVPLARMKKRIWTNNETFSAHIDLAHYGPAGLEPAQATWCITDADGKTVASGKLPDQRVATGKLAKLGEIAVPLAKFNRAQKLNLEVALKDTPYANDWDIWVFPSTLQAGKPDAPDAEVKIVNELDDNAVAHLSRGGKVLWLPSPNSIRGDHLGQVMAGFSSIFWNTAWTSHQPPHTLGILCDTNHPAFKHFPTEFHSNWQWWELLAKVHPFLLEHLEPEPEARAINPIVRMIDDWFTNRKLALEFEANVNGGKLIACAIDLQSDLEQRPVARQLRHSLLNYMHSAAFAPKPKLSVEQLRSLIKEPSVLQKLGATIRADSVAGGYPAANVIDENPSTIWHSPWGSGAPGFPHELILDLKKPVAISGVVLLPRQDLRNGWIKDYAVYVGLDGNTWNDAVIQGRLQDDKSENTLRFNKPVAGRYIRLVAKSTFDNAPYASLAEIKVLTEP